MPHEDTTVTGNIVNYEQPGYSGHFSVLAGQRNGMEKEAP